MAPRTRRSQMDNTREKRTLDSSDAAPPISSDMEASAAKKPWTIGKYFAECV